MDFNNINYKEINDYEEKEKDPIKYLNHFRCTIDKEKGKMVEDEYGEFVIWDAALDAIGMGFDKYEEKYRKYIKRLNFMEIILVIAVTLNLLSAILRFFID